MTSNPPPSKKLKSASVTFKGIKDIQKILECPICLQIPKNPDQVHFCSNGHLICHDCHSKVQNCPICRSDDLNGQNPLLKQVLSALPKLCPYQGCEAEPKDDELEEHRKICLYRPIDCLAHSKKCIEKVPFNSLVKHHEERHKITIRSNSGEYRITIKESHFASEMIYWDPNVIRTFEEHTFFLRCFITKNLFIIQCFIHGTETDAKKYSCEISISNKANSRYKLFFPCDVISVDIPKTANESNDFKDNITLSKNIIQKIWSNENDAISIQASIQKH